jgi:hypothetical protein
MTEMRGEQPCAHCAHERAVHLHNRPGSDCGRCGCDSYRPSVAALVGRVFRFRGNVVVDTVGPRS